MKDTLLALNKIDLRLTKDIQLKTPGSYWRTAVILAHSGDSWVWAIGLGLLWLFSFSNPTWHRHAAILEISVVIQALFVFALKRLIHRERPDGTWGGIYRQFDPHSFPSGHATRAALMVILAISLGPAWFGWILALWAPLVCLSRIMTGLHYLSDIFGGILLGLMMGPLLLAFSVYWIQWFPFLF